MYHGEVNVDQEELNNFLAVAEDLKVKGLIQSNQEDPEEYTPAPTENKTLPKRVDKVSMPGYRMQPKIKAGYENVSGHQESVKIRNPLPEVKTKPHAPVEIKQGCQFRFPYGWWGIDARFATNLEVGTYSL